MKKLFSVGLISLLTVGCGGGDYVHSQEPRSMVYYGQPVADLYENFGAPTKGIRLSDNERILIYISQEIDKEWAYRYVRGCVMKFHLKDDRVINWSADGQACIIQSSDPEEIEEAMEQERKNAPVTDLGLFDDESKTEIIVSDETEASDAGLHETGVLQLPDDAFDGKASTLYNGQYEISHLYHYNPETKVIQKVDKVSEFKENVAKKHTIINKTVVDANQLQHLPTDAFDGKASVIYIPQMQVQTQEKVAGQMIQQLPSDAFHGQASTMYHTQQLNQFVSNGKVQQKTVIPSDAFDGRASVPVVPVVPAQQQDDDEWGLFD